jgi:hypothetical protein
MGVVDLHHQVRDGELQLVRPQPLRLALRREAEARPEIQQDISGLCDDVLAGLRIGGANGGCFSFRRSMNAMFDSRPRLRATST